MRLDHIGIVVKDIEQYRDYYIKTFCCEPLSGIVDEPAHGVRIMFLGTGNGEMPMIELVTPSSKDSKVQSFLDMRLRIFEETVSELTTKFEGKGENQSAVVTQDGNTED